MQTLHHPGGPGGLVGTGKEREEKKSKKKSQAEKSKTEHSKSEDKQLNPESTFNAGPSGNKKVNFWLE